LPLPEPPDFAAVLRPPDPLVPPPAELLAVPLRLAAAFVPLVAVPVFAVVPLFVEDEDDALFVDPDFVPSVDPPADLPRRLRTTAVAAATAAPATTAPAATLAARLPRTFPAMSLAISPARSARVGLPLSWSLWSPTPSEPSGA
jgi:hypothetical protein